MACESIVVWLTVEAGWEGALLYLVEPVLGADVSETVDGEGRRLLAAEPVIFTRKPLSMLLLELRPAPDLTLSV